MKKSDNVFIQFFKSFYSFKNYEDFSKTKGTNTFVYILLLVCITYAFAFILPVNNISKYFFKINGKSIDFILKVISFFVKEYDISNIYDFLINDFLKTVSEIKQIIIMIYILGFVFCSVVFLLDTLICGIIGVIIDVFVKARMRYGLIFKITIYARTAPIVINAALSIWLKTNMPFVIYYTICGIYIYMALKAIKNSEYVNAG